MVWKCPLPDQQNTWSCFYNVVKLCDEELAEILTRVKNIDTDPEDVKENSAVNGVPTKNSYRYHISVGTPFFCSKLNGIPNFIELQYYVLGL